MRKKPTLTREDWILAAFRALTKGGPQMLKAESLARDLAVSKGSFYWHFKNVDDLKQAMIAHWRQVATAGIIAEITRTGQAPRAALSRLLALSVVPRDAPFGGPATEAAIRDWARFEAFVAEAVTEVDRQRVQFVTGLMAQYGLPASEAAQKARLLYGALIGLEALIPAGFEQVREDLQALLAALLAPRRERLEQPGHVRR